MSELQTNNNVILVNEIFCFPTSKPIL